MGDLPCLSHGSSPQSELGHNNPGASTTRRICFCHLLFSPHLGEEP
ncbi:unnamed protein product [Penicillium camemberti]|uniref:Str. FM013 n=1 Tax=Penicillium camemberti (strain FM 013) TaxID=1429867 RepID=A0A0G4PHR7_PENC3|nr:unnamed protein product [Penicillium camemberti]